ncbi:MAG: hypothetical protein ABSA90_01005 [Xanthobacteraceae bacterium]
MRYRVGGGAAAVIHQPDEALPTLRQLIRHPPETAERAVDELDPAFLIEHDDAVVQIVDDRAQGNDLRRHGSGFGAEVLSAAQRT